jgi:hypothetical protein
MTHMLQAASSEMSLEDSPAALSRRSICGSKAALQDFVVRLWLPRDEVLRACFMQNYSRPFFVYPFIFHAKFSVTLLAANIGVE